MIGSFDLLMIDCPAPGPLADFYAELLGWRKVRDEPDIAEIMSAPNGRPIIGFQRVDDYAAPEWPGQEHPQQMHLDVKVEDFDAGEQAVLALGARTTGVNEPGYRVYLDPAGHPFCLIIPSD